MEQNLLKRGQKVVLEKRKDERVWRYTFIVDLVLPQQLLLTPLTEGEVVSAYEPGDKIIGYIPTPIRVYQFESVVVQLRGGVSPRLMIRHPERIVPVQRRRFFRVRILRAVKLLPVLKENETSSDQPIEAYGTDISGGGIGIRIDTRKVPFASNFREYQKLKLSFSLPPVEKAFPEGLTVEVEGEISWTHRNGQFLRLGVAFTDIDRRLQERIISWCFAYHCKLLRLGLWRDEG